MVWLLRHKTNQQHVDQSIKFIIKSNQKLPYFIYLLSLHSLMRDASLQETNLFTGR